MSDLSGTGILLSEFIGTALLLLLGIGVGANTTLSRSFGHGRDWLLISLGWGFAVFVGASVAWRSGAQLNPAVTLALAMTGSVPWHQVPWFFVFLGPGPGRHDRRPARLPHVPKSSSTPTTTRGRPVGCSSRPPRCAPAWNVLTEAIGAFVLIYWVLESTPFQPGTGTRRRSSATPRWGTPASPSR